MSVRSTSEHLSQLEDLVSNLPDLDKFFKDEHGSSITNQPSGFRDFSKDSNCHTIGGMSTHTQKNDHSWTIQTRQNRQ